MERKGERLLNLIALLLNTRRPLTAAEIRERITEYREERTDEAFHRMFERDKAEIREIYEVEQADADAWGEPGYRIATGRALLDDPGLTPEEIAALSLAAQAWGGGEGDGALGFLKLAIGQPGAAPSGAGFLLPRVPLDKGVAKLMDAVARRKRVTFRYRTGGGGEPQKRSVDPHGLYHRGSWYLAGYDHDRGEVRHFKLARVVGTISVKGGTAPDFDEPPRAAPDVPRGPWEGESDVSARVAFSPEVAWWAQRRTGATVLAERDDGWTEVTLPVADLEAFAGWIAGFGPEAVVLDPLEVRDAVVAHLRGVVEVLDG